jgi:hypothetical protein
MGDAPCSIGAPVQSNNLNRQRAGQAAASASPALSQVGRELRNPGLGARSKFSGRRRDEFGLIKVRSTQAQSGW